MVTLDEGGFKIGLGDGEGDGDGVRVTFVEDGFKIGLGEGTGLLDLLGSTEGLDTLVCTDMIYGMEV